MDLTLQDFEDSVIARSVVARVVEATQPVTTAETFNGTKFYNLFEDIERQTKDMGSALGKYARDPGKMKPQLDNLSKAATRIATDIRIIQRMVDTLQR